MSRMYVYRLCLSRKRMRRLSYNQVQGLDLVTYGIYYKKYIGVNNCLKHKALNYQGVSLWN